MFDELIETATGRQRHAIHASNSLFRRELENVFGRCWLFLTHDSLIPNAGDFVVSRMGTDEVLVVRQKDGSAKAFLNACRHRGARLCPHEAGNAASFVCAYHGWAYTADGNLNAVPFDKSLYDSALNKSAHSLHGVAKIDSFHGFIYGCFDPEAPSLAEYLGDLKWYLEPYLSLSGGVDLVGPPGRCLIAANWKAPSENFVGDAYHVGWTHASALRSGKSIFSPLAGNTVLPEEGAGVQVTSKYGSGLGVLWDAYAGVHDGELAKELMAFGLEKEKRLAKEIGAERARIYRSHLNGTIFPNNSFLTCSGIFKVWQPHSEDCTEVYSWVMVEKDMSEDLKAAFVSSVHRTFGVTGYWESDDNDNMESETFMGRGHQAGKRMLNSQMGIGGDRLDRELPGVIGRSAIGETSYRGYYRFYNDLITSGSWAQVDTKSESWQEQLVNAKS